MSERIRAGVIGLGVGLNHANGYLRNPDAELVALCDMSEARLHTVGEELGIPPERRFTDVERLLSVPGLDAVSITLPNHLHAPIALAAFQAGLHVLCEKPLARSAQEAQTIVDAAHASGRTLMVCHNYRFRPDARWLHTLEQEGQFGRIYYAKAGWVRNRGIPGVGSWFTRGEQAGGGPLIDLGVHMLDLSLWLMGHPRAVSVSGSTFAEFGPRGMKGFQGRWATTGGGVNDVEDLASGFVRFENGATLTLEVAWASHTASGRDDYFVTLFGTDGGAELYVANYADMDTVRYFTEVGDAPVEMRPTIRSTVKGHYLAVDHFVHALQTGTPPESTGEQGVALLQIIDALYQSGPVGARGTAG